MGVRVITDRQHYGGGSQVIYRFTNSRGASVITGKYAYGGREIAVLRFPSPTSDRHELDYTTPLTDDVIGWLQEDEVDDILDAIEALPHIDEIGGGR